MAISRKVRDAQGFSMVEAILSIILVSVMFVAAINTLAAAKTSRASVEGSVHGPQLAQSLMEEILAQAYEEPEEGVTPVFGPESGETIGGGTRATFDDVDDYHNYNETTLTDHDGASIDGYTGWTRHVAVSWANVNTIAGNQASDTGLKIITVTVKYNGKVTTTLQALRSDWNYAE